MKRDEIIGQLYRSQTIEKTARKLYTRIGSEDTYRDLVQEVYLMVCAMSEEKLHRLYDDGALERYAAKMTIHQIVNKNSVFHVKYAQLETHKKRESYDEDRLQQ